MDGLTANFEVLIVISVMFVIALGGAYILFRFLESQATIQRAGYKAGGALAGFLIILGVLFGGYHKLVQAQVQQDSEIKWTIIGQCHAPPSRRDDITVNIVEPEMPGDLLPVQEKQFLLKGVHLTQKQISEGSLPILQFFADGLQTESVTLTKEMVRIDPVSKRLVLIEPVQLHILNSAEQSRDLEIDPQDFESDLKTDARSNIQ